MKSPNSNSHLSLNDRRIILAGIMNGSTKAAIAQTLGKDKSTIGKEIKAHRILSYKSRYSIQCGAFRTCKKRASNECSLSCPGYFPFKCSRRDRSPGACNGCSGYGSCRFDKYSYNPEKAYADYRETLVDSRSGANLTFSEAKAIADVVGPLLKQGQSPYVILTNHPELGICEKTIYNYLEKDVLHFAGDVTNMDLRLQVKRKPMKKKVAVQYKKREDRSFLRGRLYTDFLELMKDNEDAFFIEMDTVYNDVSNGPFIQTFKFMSTGLLFGILHESKNAIDMVNGMNTLENILGRDVFSKYCNLTLTDRGSEFYSADALETSADGSRRTFVFYCDSMASYQKGSLENKHRELRYILPKETDLYALGLTNQHKLNLVLSHVNSTPVEKFGGRTPLEVTEFLYPDLFEKLIAFGLQKIEKDKVILKPYLLKG